MPFAGIL